MEKWKSKADYKSMQQGVQEQIWLVVECDFLEIWPMTNWYMHKSESILKIRNKISSDFEIKNDYVIQARR